MCREPKLSLRKKKDRKNNITDRRETRSDVKKRRGANIAHYDDSDDTGDGDIDSATGVTHIKTQL